MSETPASRTRLSESPTTRTRLQIEFNEDALERIEKMKKATEARTSGELVRNALRMYEWLLEQQADGFHIQVAKDGLVREVKILFTK